MARPVSGNPRGVVVKFRVTVEERAAIEASREAAGLSMSDFLRGSVLGGSVDAARSVVVAQARADAMPMLPSLVEGAPKERLPDRSTPGLYWCPEALCQFRSVGPGTCPVHKRSTERGF